LPNYKTIFLVPTDYVVSPKSYSVTVHKTDYLRQLLSESILIKGIF